MLIFVSFIDDDISEKKDLGLFVRRKGAAICFLMIVSVNKENACVVSDLKSKIYITR